MTVSRMRREMSGLEYAGWVALHNLKAKERRAEEAKQRGKSRRR